MERLGQLLARGNTMLDDRRKGRITASAVGAILNCSPFSNPKKELRRMVREHHNIKSDFTGNPATQWGHFAEPLAIADHELLYGKLEKGHFVIHPHIDWLGATPDGFVDNDTLLEIKSPFKFKDGIPEGEQFKTLAEQPHYYAQVQIQLYCTGYEKCFFLQWCPKSCLYETVYFNQDYIDAIMPKLREFYELYLSELDNPEHLEDEIEVIPDHLAAHDYRAALDNFNKAKADLDECKKQLIELANGKKSRIGGLLVYKTEKQGSISYAKAIKKYCPDADLEPFRGKSTEYWSVK